MTATATTAPADARAAVAAQFAAADAKLARLAALQPLLLDVSLREPCFSSYLGHTLQNKIDLLQMVDGFGFTDKIIATLDYQLPDFPEVEDDFCQYLNQTGYDLTGCFAETSVGTLSADGQFEPTVSMLKLVDYHIPNTLHEIYLLPETTPLPTLLATLTASVQWLRAKMTGDAGGPPRIFINIPDLVDGFIADQQFSCAVLEHLRALNVDALSFEDARGTYFPFQIGAVVASAKLLLDPQQKVLFHCHAGNGMENASVLEALLQGADGYWAGLDRESSTIGHAALSELIANLMRAGNTTMAQRYRVDTLLPVCHAMHLINDAESTPATWPIQGSNAYRQMLTDFDQVPGRLMDLPPERIGARYTSRISPAGSDWLVIQARVLQALGADIDQPTANRMILLMRQDLRQGQRIRYDDPAPLADLLARAKNGA